MATKRSKYHTVFWDSFCLAQHTVGGKGQVLNILHLLLQEVLKELLAEKLPKLSQHFTKHGVDPALFTLNWFLCVFVDTIPVKTYLHIWDAFLFEGSKVSSWYFFYLTFITLLELIHCFEGNDAVSLSYQHSKMSPHILCCVL